MGSNPTVAPTSLQISSLSQVKARTHGRRGIQVNWVCVSMLGAICGSARSMDRAAQSVCPYFAQESMDRAEICGSIHEFCI